mgnify:CR=1 FL=1
MAMVSMDNCSHNGDKLYAAINTFAEKWEENKLTDAGFRAYVNCKEKVTFPMDHDRQDYTTSGCFSRRLLKKDGIEELVSGDHIQEYVCGAICKCRRVRISCHRKIAFPERKTRTGKRRLMFTERETVDKVEKMKSAPA